jgi:Ca2+-binding RTX toxin-like protein
VGQIFKFTLIGGEMFTIRLVISSIDSVKITPDDKGGVLNKDRDEILFPIFGEKTNQIEGTNQNLNAIIPPPGTLVPGDDNSANDYYSFKTGESVIRANEVLPIVLKQFDINAGENAGLVINISERDSEASIIDVITGAVSAVENLVKTVTAIIALDPISILKEGVALGKSSYELYQLANAKGYESIGAFSVGITILNGKPEFVWATDERAQTKVNLQNPPNYNSASFVSTGAGAEYNFTVTAQILDTIISPLEQPTLEGRSEKNLILIGAEPTNLKGNSADNIIVGNDADNIIEGFGGRDQLYGGVGNDTLRSGGGGGPMFGGFGDDIYWVSSFVDGVFEQVNEGFDTVNSSLSYTLTDNVEKLDLIGIDAINGTGNSLDNIIFGQESANFLSGFDGDDRLAGNEGNDTLRGGTGDDTLRGGLGSDSMFGEEGDDTYEVDSTTDIVSEKIGQGTDIIQSSIDYTLGNNLENLVLTDTAIRGTGNFLENNLAGNSRDNILAGGDRDDVIDDGDIFATTSNDILYGEAGDDSLKSRYGNDVLDGGLGADSMIGGKDNDTYIVDHAADTITEYFDEGIDVVQASISYTLSETLENLALIGNAVANGTGNSLSNIITGNIAGNYLYGADGNDNINGKAGKDYLYGQVGDDTLVAETGKDYLDGGSGDDSLYGGADRDNLIGGLGDDILSGDTGGDFLTGGAGDDILSGGADSDQLTGGIGADQFAFHSLRQGKDVITDFRLVQNDRILVSAQGFSKKLKIGRLSKAQFSIGSIANNKNSRFVYNPFTGALFFDSDGSGSARQIQFAQLSPKLTLSNKAIYITG